MANRAEIIYGNLGDYYLSISYEKSQFWALLVIFDFLGLTWVQKWAWPHAHPYGSGVSKPNQKVDPLGGSFGYTIISKPCFRFFWGTNQPPPPLM